MPLRRRLHSSEKDRRKFKRVSAAIEALKALLKSPADAHVVIEGWKAVKAKYGDPRRTQIIRLGEGEKVSGPRLM